MWFEWRACELAPNRAPGNSQGCKPLVSAAPINLSPNGATRDMACVAPLGLIHIVGHRFQALSRLVISCRPFGAETISATLFNFATSFFTPLLPYSLSPFLPHS